MANNNLQFGRQMSIAAFKAHHNVSKIDIVRNPNTSKLFFASPDDSQLSGAVSDNWKEDPVFTEVTSKDSGEVFWLLHKRGGKGDNVEESI